MKITNEINDLHADMTSWRRHLHAWPELGYQEHRTADFVAERLASFGLEVHRGLGGTGVVGVLKVGDGPGTIGLRADMDALPMPEAGAHAHCSKNPGVFHACGHDGHMAMLLGAAQHLARTRRFNGTVHCIFQPAEEGLAGARAMIQDGLFERFPCDEVYAMHNWPGLPPGQLAVHTGPVMASADLFEIEVHGKGGHAAMPHLCLDPVVVAAHLITALQTIVSRGNPTEAAVVSVSQLNAGTAHNVLPDTAVLRGTARALSPATRARVEAEIRRISAGMAAAFGARIEVHWHPTYPPTVNHAGPAKRAARVAGPLFEAVHTDLPPTMGAEDFAFMLEARPGAYLWLGGGGVGLHGSRYDFNDAVLPLGAALFCALVEDVLPGQGLARSEISQ